MKTFYIAAGIDNASVRFGQLVKLSNGIHVFVEKRGREWTVTELLTGLLIPLKDENKTKLRLCLWELDVIQERIYNAVRGAFASPYIYDLREVMFRRGWRIDELNDIRYFAREGKHEEFLDEYKNLCGYALAWAKGKGKEEQK